MTRGPATSMKGVIVAHGQVLLCRNDRGDWELPGGRPDESDASPQETVLREIREETGLRVAVGELLGGGMVQVPEGEVKILGYRATIDGPRTAPVLSGEHEELRYFDVTDLPDELPPVYRALIGAAVAC